MLPTTLEAEKQPRPTLEQTSSTKSHLEDSLLFSEVTRPTRPERVQHDLQQPSSPEDGGNFRKSLQIDMKGLVGDAVGNMSISPASRDVVLAARRGLFIIDLEAPLEVPRFLPQGGTWDVADVQWNPHPSRAEYIVSTSSEKLLIWNLRIVGKTSIEHILHSHYRAITDINWHTTERDTVVSTGIDSWLWAWDLREPRKPIFAAGTQVKWNRQDPNILASSHANHVLIWDRRKGSLPVAKIQGHTSKIYGIDWSHSLSNEIVTCSLDKTIKVWDLNSLPDSSSQSPEPQTMIHTTYPVWRARYLPFGHGVLSLAQRGETALEMYAQSDSKTPVETFEGHTDVVKEFVWRKGAQGTEFQLITWSKDRTLRFWPVESEAMQKVGHTAEIARGRQSRPPAEPSISFRNPPQNSNEPPLFSAPIGHRSILAEVRAGLPMNAYTSQLGSAGPLRISFQARLNDNTSIRPIRMPSLKKGGTMSRGNIGGKSLSRVDALSWLSSVKVSEGPRGSSSGPGSGGNSAEASRFSSRSASGEPITNRKLSDSFPPLDEKKEGEGSQSLQDEITSVLTKLASSKIKLEKHDLMKKRTCTLGLHGPWGDSSSVFIRVTFVFPRDYPHSSGIPSIELERNPLISLKNRAFMLRRLRAIRETQRPCLEACLNFLLFRRDEKVGHRLPLDSESSSEDEDDRFRTSRDFHVSVHKNLTEPRTSQGCFGPNGELVCFFRAPPRIVRNVLRGVSESPPVNSSGTPRSQDTEDSSQFNQPPSLLSDAIRRLSLAAVDRYAKVDPRRSGHAEHMIRTMTNLLTFSQNRLRQKSQSSSLDETTKSYSLVAPLRRTIFITNTANISGGDKKVALKYVFCADSLADLCKRNADVARDHGRYDHERVFRTLGSLFPPSKQVNECENWWTRCRSSEPIEKKIISRFYQEFSSTKDLQMLAMVSMIVLQACHISSTGKETKVIQFSAVTTPRPEPGPSDYFSIAQNLAQGTLSPVASTWRGPSSPGAPTVIPLSSSTSSRGSWSSLFNTGSMRQFMTGVQDTLKDVMPLETPNLGTAIPIVLGPDSPLGKGWKGSPQYFSPVFAKSWNETAVLTARPSVKTPPRRPLNNRRYTATVLQGHRNDVVIKPVTPQVIDGKRLRFYKGDIEEERVPMFTDSEINAYTRHIQVYAEMLFRWQLFHKRLEILKIIQTTALENQHEIGIERRCSRCHSCLPKRGNACTSCHLPCSMPSCSICRLPIKGLSQSCVHCLHVTHISCWKSLNLVQCPSGCGCDCTPFRAPSLSPLASIPRSMSSS
ncbi:hypothetical protein C8J56DRAFT_971742 [Mycena floridula]|nr:hypothetical protein C8J56DRAFT_971742 [Mycena floridula]